MKEKTIENAWSILLKFGKEENLQKLQAGQFYMKNLQYYVDLEKGTSDEDVGDMYDGQMMLQDVKISVFTTDTHEFLGQISAPTASFNLGYLKCPVFCMFMMDYRNHVSERLDGDTLTVRYQFTEEQLAKMPSFGDSVLIIKNADEFFNRVKGALLASDIGYSRDFVSYYGFNNVDHLKQIQKDNLRIAFWKRQKYEYQQEYRLVAHTEVDDYLCVEIGDISDTTEIMKTEQLLNTYLEVTFSIKPME